MINNLIQLHVSFSLINECWLLNPTMLDILFIE